MLKKMFCEQCGCTRPREDFGTDYKICNRNHHEEGFMISLSRPNAVSVKRRIGKKARKYNTSPSENRERLVTREK